jgi:hypothetical protein
MRLSYLLTLKPLLQLSAFPVLTLCKNDCFRRVLYNQKTSILSSTSIIQQSDLQLILFSSSETQSKYEPAGKMEDLILHLPKLASGASFQRVVPNKVTENKGPEELFPEAYWVDEIWHKEIRIASKTYRLYQEIGRTRNRRIQELLYWREDRADTEAIREAARQTYKEKQLLQEAREEAVSQGQRRSERGRIPLKRNREP